MWRWCIHAISGPGDKVKTSGAEASLEDAQAAVRWNWEAWLVLAGLTETAAAPAVMRDDHAADESELPTHVYRPTSDGRYFSNATSTGNDLDFSGDDNRYTKRLVRDSLALWHQTYGIDGFRFDLARILADGSQNAADWIDNDPRFAAAHLHAEPWDLGGVRGMALPPRCFDERIQLL